jgi:hypothetical protein
LNHLIAICLFVRQWNLKNATSVRVFVILDGKMHASKCEEVVYIHGFNVPEWFAPIGAGGPAFRRKEP